MVYRNNAGRLGSGFISVCLETRSLSQKSGYHVPEQYCRRNLHLSNSPPLSLVLYWKRLVKTRSCGVSNERRISWKTPRRYRPSISLVWLSIHSDFMALHSTWLWCLGSGAPFRIADWISRPSQVALITVALMSQSHQMTLAMRQKSWHPTCYWRLQSCYEYQSVACSERQGSKVTLRSVNWLS